VPDPTEDTWRSEIGPDLGRELRAARRAQGWSYRTAARRIGISPGYLWLLEAGTRAPSLDVALDLARALQLPELVVGRLLAAAVSDAGRCSPYQGGGAR